MTRKFTPYTERYGGFNSALDALQDAFADKPPADAAEAMRRLDMQTEALCADLLMGRVWDG